MAFSRLGVYIRLPGVDVAKFEQSMQGGGLLGYIDALSGGSISKVGVFSLGKPLAQHVTVLLQSQFILYCTMHSAAMRLCVYSHYIVKVGLSSTHIKL